MSSEFNRISNMPKKYPLEFAKTRVQLRAQKGIPTPRNPFLVVTRVYQNEGLRALYKGCAALVVVRPPILPFLSTLVLVVCLIVYTVLSLQVSPELLFRNTSKPLFQSAC